MTCQGILSMQPGAIEIPVRACGRAGIIGVLRLSSCFAGRSSYYAQDDRVISFSLNTLGRVPSPADGAAFGGALRLVLPRGRAF